MDYVVLFLLFLLRQKEQNYRSTEFLLVALIVAYILCDTKLGTSNLIEVVHCKASTELLRRTQA